MPVTIGNICTAIHPSDFAHLLKVCNRGVEELTEHVVCICRQWKVGTGGEIVRKGDGGRGVGRSWGRWIIGGNVAPKE